MRGGRAPADRAATGTMKRLGGIFFCAIILSLAGLAAIAAGLVGAFGGATREGRFLTGAVAIPFGFMLLELGLGGGWLAARARRGAAAPATLPPWWGSALAFAAAVLGGWLALRFGQWWAFFPLATVAVFAPVAAAGRLGLPGRGLRPGWGRLIAAFAWGALVTPALAIALELLAVVGVGLVAFFGLSASGQRNLDLLGNTWRFYLQGRSLDADQQVALLQFAVRQPIVLLAGATILVFVAPATEELGKFGGVLLLGRRHVASGPGENRPLTVFLIGLASGLGFAATENIFYVAQAGEAGWATMTLVRAATPLMHGTASALFALGWARQGERPQGWALLWGALGSLGLHAAWNFSAGLTIVGGVFAAGSSGATALAGLLVVLALACLGGLAILSIIILLRQRRALARPATEAAPPTAPQLAPPLALPAWPTPPPAPATGPPPVALPTTTPAAAATRPHPTDP